MPKIILIEMPIIPKLPDSQAILDFQKRNQTERSPDPTPLIPVDRKGIREEMKSLRKTGCELKFLDKRRFTFAEHSIPVQFRYCDAFLNRLGINNLLASSGALQDLDEAEKSVFHEV